jgi:hypothetical protein
MEDDVMSLFYLFIWYIGVHFPAHASYLSGSTLVLVDR